MNGGGKNERNKESEQKEQLYLIYTKTAGLPIKLNKP